MSRNKLLLLLFVVVISALVVWLRLRSATPPSVAFTAVQQETLVSTLPTNGKVEPSDWVAVRAEQSGVVERVAVQRGQQVPAGALLAELDARDARAGVASAEAAVAQAKAKLQTLTQGGTDASRVEIDNEIERQRMALPVAEREQESLQRLAAKHAATEQEVAEAQQRVQTLRAALQALERKRGALVGPADRAAA
ncbi:MAG TPA: biotin/lipoyl-binding protein, partial [Bryobacteraceae bacterium]